MLNNIIHRKKKTPATEPASDFGSDSAAKPGKKKGAGLLARIKQLPDLLKPPRRILALEIAGSQIMGALLEQRRGQIHILNFAAIERTVAGEDLPDSSNIKELVERLGYGGGPAVLVTPMARSIQLSMNRKKAEKLRNYQLCDALRWEVEPYTGITGTVALIGAVKGDPSASEEELLLMEDDEVEVEISVSVIERNVYRAITQIFKRCGLKLSRLYPPEVCFFMPLFLEPLEASLAVFDIGVDYANFAMLKGRQPKQISTYPLGQEVLLEYLDSGMEGDVGQSLAFLLNQAPGPLPLVLTGMGAGQARIVDYLKEKAPYGAEVFQLRREEKLSRTSSEALNAMYCRVVGAAVRELFPARWQLIGISDTIPLPVRIKQSAYVAPLLAAVLMVGGLYGHYNHMKVKRAEYAKQTAKLQQEISGRKAAHEAYNKVKKERDTAQSRVNLYQKQLTFLKQGTDDNLIHLEEVLRVFFQLPPSMRLESLIQQEKGFLLSGTAEDVAAVSQYAVFLQRFPWCETVKILEMREAGEDALEFRLDLLTKKAETP